VDELGLTFTECWEEAEAAGVVELMNRVDPDMTRAIKRFCQAVYAAGFERGSNKLAMAMHTNRHN